MSLFKLNKENVEMRALMDRVQEFQESAGKLYEKGNGAGKQGLLMPSILMKIKSGELLLEEIQKMALAASEKGEKERSKANLLQQLMIVVSEELRNLQKMRMAYAELSTAQEENRAIEAGEARRKLQMGIAKYREETGGAQ